MAKLVLKDCEITVDGVDLSCHASSVEINLTKTTIDADDFCGTNTLLGQEDSTITINFHQDFEVGAVDDTLFPLWDEDSEFEVTVKPTKDATAADNPEYSATCILPEYMPLSGSVNTLSETSVTFPVQGSVGRSVTP